MSEGGTIIDAPAAAVSIPQSSLPPLENNSSSVHNIDTIQTSKNAKYTLPIPQLLAALGTDPQTGLSNEEVASRISKYGKNELQGDTGARWVKILLRHLLNFMNFILLGAAIIAAAVSDWIDFAVLVFIIITNVVIGFSQEFKSEQTMQKLKSMTAATSSVRRSGALADVSSSELVIGDIVLIRSGYKIPADMRLIQGTNLETDESILTGESVPVAKDPDAVLPTDEEVSTGDRINCVFMNSTCVKGQGLAVVIGTGMKTEVGAIAKSLASAKKEETKLNKRLRILGIVAIVAGLISFALVLLGVWGHRGQNGLAIVPDGLLIGVAVAISVVPQALIAVMTVTMSIGVQQMARQRAIVRQLAALESLGNITNICSDKTGTLTQAKMVVRRVWSGGRTYHVSEEGGVVKILSGRTNEQIDDPLSIESLRMTMLVSALCNTSNVEPQNSFVSIDIPSSERLKADEPSIEQKKKQKKKRKSKKKKAKDAASTDNKSQQGTTQGRWIVTGEPTELALHIFAKEFNFGREEAMKEFPIKLKEFPFDSTVKRMTVVYEKPDDPSKVWVLTKGAPERVRTTCTQVAIDTDNNCEDMSPEFNAEIQQVNLSWAENGLRVICLACKVMNKEEVLNATREEIERDLTYLASVGIYDPPREQSKYSVEVCHKAGITVHMLTGDHIQTAFSISKQVGILPEHATFENSQGLVVQATDFDNTPIETLVQNNTIPLVIARCTPTTKVKMVQLLHSKRKFVIMTGDGVNDAPAIKSADVGIAMGSGSDVAKEAADVVVTDDDFSTIVVAIREGRRVFENIRKFIIYMLSANVAEAVSILIPVLVGITLPLEPIQILWINIITVTPPSLALGAESPSKYIMDASKRKVGASMFSLGAILDIIFFGLTLCAFTLGVFYLYIFYYPYANIREWQSTAFTALAIMLSIHVYNCRSTRRSLFRDSVWRRWKIHLSAAIGVGTTVFALYVPWINNVLLKLTPIGGISWVFVIISTIIFLIFIEVYKRVKKVVRDCIKKAKKSHAVRMRKRRAPPLPLEINNA